MTKLTLDQAMDKVNKQLDSPAPYYGEITLSVKVDSKMQLEKLQSMADTFMDIDDLILRLVDGSQLKAEVLDVEDAEWDEWDNI